MVQINADELKQIEIRMDVRNSMLKLLENELRVYIQGLAQKHKVEYKNFNIDITGNFIELKEEIKEAAQEVTSEQIAEIVK